MSDQRHRHGKQRNVGTQLHIPFDARIARDGTQAGLRQLISITSDNTGNLLMSINTDGRANRMFSIGTKLCPPASTFASSPYSAFKVDVPLQAIPGGGTERARVSLSGLRFRRS